MKMYKKLVVGFLPHFDRLFALGDSLRYVMLGYVYTQTYIFIIPLFLRLMRNSIPMSTLSPPITGYICSTVSNLDHAYSLMLLIFSS